MTTDEASSRTIELLEELVALTRFAARTGLEETLKATLRDPRHQTVYELTDGTHSQTDIEKLARIDQTTVSDLWSRWRRMGLLREGGRRPRHLVSLSDLGWNVPGLTSSRSRAIRKGDIATDASPEVA